MSAYRHDPQVTAQVLAIYGNKCWLGLPGCRRTATTVDHVIPQSHGGSNSIENYRPACGKCNFARQNRVISGMGATITVVMGPPAGGKTTYINEHWRPGDVKIDYDAIAVALQGEGASTHDHPTHIKHIVQAMRTTAINQATRLRKRVHVWIIDSTPTPKHMAEYRALKYQLVTIDPGREVVEARAAGTRPTSSFAGIARWYSDLATSTPAPTLARPLAVASSEGRPW